MLQIRMWFCFGRVNFDLPRTNNALQGWHKALRERIPIYLVLMTRLNDTIGNSVSILIYLELITPLKDGIGL